jgi:hypothetical protein
MTTTKFSCKISTTDSSALLGLEAWIDDHKFFDLSHVTDSQEISTEINDDEAEHVLRLVMKNKILDHTKINDAGEIVQDARLVIEDIAFDGIKLNHMFTKLATYTHDFNGTGAEIQDKFYGEMGCNGTVKLEFTTPVYLWLLEHM